MGKQREGKKKKFPFSCTSTRGPLFNCIIVNEVLMQLQERGLLSLSSHESHVSFSPDWGHEITEHSFYPLLLFLQTHLPSYQLWRLAFCALHVTLHHPPSCNRKEQRGLLNLCVCAGEFEMQWLFVYFSVGGAAEALWGLFIIPLSSWIRAGIIIPSMNIHETRIWESTRETDRQKQTDRQSHKQPFTYSHTVRVTFVSE